MKVINLITGIAVLVMSIPAGAAENDQQKLPRRHHRVQDQVHSIRKQYQNGNLTLDEAKKLRDQQREIKEVIRSVEADGNVTAEEKARVEALQDKARARITLQSSDKQEAKEKSRRQVRQYNQKERIKDGVADGSLTAEEAKDLRAYIKKNAEMIKGAKADGTLTDEEKKRIEARQDILSADIYLRRHNGATRGPASAPAAAPASADAAPEAPVADPASVPMEDTGGLAGFLPADGVK